MIETLIRPVTRELGIALTFAAAVLCIPTPGFAEPIGLSNMASFAVRDVSEVFKTYSGAAHWGDGFVVLHDALRDGARTALASPANWPSGDGGLRNDSVSRVASGTSVATTIPEPTTLILLSAGLFGAAMWTRRRDLRNRL